MNLKEFSELIKSMSGHKDPCLRRGQFMFNTLYRRYPAIANRIDGTEFDPFYVDDRIPKFISYLTEFISNYKD